MCTEDAELHADDVVLTVCPNGGRVTRFAIGGVDVLRPGADYGSFPMAPWCGRMRDGTLSFDGRHHRFPPAKDEAHALHGTARDGRWTIERRSGADAVLTHELCAPWPFPGKVIQEIGLGTDHASFRMSVTAAAESFPAQAGWHPWFPRRLGGEAAELTVRFDPEWQEQRGADYLPTGWRIPPLPGPWDDCFGMPGGVTVALDWPGVLDLRLTSPARWVVVYDLPTDTVCVEPQSGPPNGLNTVPEIVTPDNPLTVEMRWEWTRSGIPRRH